MKINCLHPETLKWSVQVNDLLNNCKQNITSLSLSVTFKTTAVYCIVWAITPAFLFSRSVTYIRVTGNSVFQPDRYVGRGGGGGHASRDLHLLYTKWRRSLEKPLHLYEH